MYMYDTHYNYLTYWCSTSKLVMQYASLCYAPSQLQQENKSGSTGSQRNTHEVLCEYQYYLTFGNFAFINICGIKQQMHINYKKANKLVIIDKKTNYNLYIAIPLSIVCQPMQRL